MSTSITNPLSAVWQRYLHSLKTEPVATKILTSAVLTCVGNLFSQKMSGSNKKESDGSIDWTRTRGFMLASIATTPIAHLWLQKLETLTDNMLVKVFYDRVIFR